MEYPFWVNDFNKIKSHIKNYPLASKIFEYPSSFWYGGFRRKSDNWLEGSIRRLLKRTYPSLPIIVLYNIPNRDLGHHSRGGAGNRERYLEYIKRVAKGIGDSSPIVIYEPDALPHSTLLSKSDQRWRLSLMKESLEYLTDKWSKKICMLRRQDYYVIDTSRNGQGNFSNDWCNPPDRGLGIPPTCNTKHRKCDAYLWIKVPGESDGKCNGGPRAGKFWGEQAETLVRNRI
jgi:endoglucanase